MHSAVAPSVKRGGFRRAEGHGGPERAGVHATRAAESFADATNTWQQLNLTLTPSARGIVTIQRLSRSDSINRAAY